MVHLGEQGSQQWVSLFINASALAKLLAHISSLHLHERHLLLELLLLLKDLKLGRLNVFHELGRNGNLRNLLLVLEIIHEQERVIELVPFLIFLAYSSLGGHHILTIRRVANGNGFAGIITENVFR